MNTFRKQCRKLRREDKTLTEIMEITGRPKTSVWHHIRDIDLSTKNKKKLTVISYSYWKNIDRTPKGGVRRVDLPTLLKSGTWDV